MNVTTLKRQDQAAEERDPLRAAIEAEAEARRAVDRAEQALQRGRAVVATAQAKLESAKHLVGKAKEHDSRAMAAAVRNKPSGATPDASGVRRARLAVVEADDDIEVAEGAIQRLEQDLAEAATAARWAENSRMVAVNNLLARHAELLLADAVAARLRLRSAEAALSEMLNNDAGPEFEDVTASIRAREERTAELLARRKDASAFFMSRRTEDEAAAEAAAVAEIRAFVARLAADSTAEPPAIP